MPGPRRRAPSSSAPHPLFVFDPDDDANAPDPVEHAGVLQYWPLYPGFVRADFVRAFTAGLHDPARGSARACGAPRLARLLDGIVRCACGRENFIGRRSDLRSRAGGCGRVVEAAVLLRTACSALVLNAGTRVTGHHLRHDYDYDSVLGRVVAHPQRPEVWGLQNTSEDAWQVRVGDVVREVGPGRAVGLVPGTRVEFGRRTTGEVVRP